ncbi:hypothetical protein LX36DRAFT_660896 [Colletotrichum falcatum]|nr:hypothetical protein LX36DRAFT_660896 [Colletotrichum falcatum]
MFWALGGLRMLDIGGRVGAVVQGLLRLMIQPLLAAAQVFVAERAQSAPAVVALEDGDDSVRLFDVTWCGVGLVWFGLV